MIADILSSNLSFIIMHERFERKVGHEKVIIMIHLSEHTCRFKNFPFRSHMIWLRTYTKHGSFFVKLIQQFVPFRIIYPCAENQAYPPIYDLPPSRESRIDFYWFNHLCGSILTFKVCI